MKQILKTQIPLIAGHLSQCKETRDSLLTYNNDNDEIKNLIPKIRKLSLT